MNTSQFEPKRLFHQGHTNKIAATLGRHFWASEREDREVIRGVAVAFMIMLEKDNPEFDGEAFVSCFLKHTVDTTEKAS